MDIFLEWKIVVGQRRFTSGHRTVGREVEDLNNHGRTKWRTSWEAETSLACGSRWTALDCIDPNKLLLFIIIIIIIIIVAMYLLSVTLHLVRNRCGFK